jgi:hypothetical protein
MVPAIISFARETLFRHHATSDEEIRRMIETNKHFMSCNPITWSMAGVTGWTSVLAATQLPLHLSLLVMAWSVPSTMGLIAHDRINLRQHLSDVAYRWPRLMQDTQFVIDKDAGDNMLKVAEDILKRLETLDDRRWDITHELD